MVATTRPPLCPRNFCKIFSQIFPEITRVTHVSTRRVEPRDPRHRSTWVPKDPLPPETTSPPVTGSQGVRVITLTGTETVSDTTTGRPCSTFLNSLGTDVRCLYLSIVRVSTAHIIGKGSFPSRSNQRRNSWIQPKVTTGKLEGLRVLGKHMRKDIKMTPKWCSVNIH